jgi:hypothetical protein
MKIARLELNVSHSSSLLNEFATIMLIISRSEVELFTQAGLQVNLGLKM